MDLNCAESAYDNFEYESDFCDDVPTPPEFQIPIDMDSTWSVFDGTLEPYEGSDCYFPNFPEPGTDPDCPPVESQACTDEEEGGDDYSLLVQGWDNTYQDYTGRQKCSDDCGRQPCGFPATQYCPLPDPNVQCPPCVINDLPREDESEFAGRGASSICGKNLQKVNEIIKNITPFTVLDEFMLSVANYTADNGESMFDAMSNEVNNFKELIKEIYANRNDAISDLLKDEQMQMKNKYEKWTKESNRKSEETLEKIKEILPDFDMSLFVADPSNYIYSAMMENFKKQARKEDVVEVNNTSLNPERNVRVAMHKKTWLLREAERIECDNEERMCKLNEMMAQLACLSEGLATSNKKLAAYNRQLESHATCLRNKMAYNETVLGCLQDEIEMSKVEASKGTDDCPLIQPDDILTPYPSGYDYC
ncbi:hypothetical protein GE061_006244 [Apolygus lucorum]|uniref:Uncharacterized protein n=1 Tax=Apolygus lucorum TaxID=248454 RepID=A0A8S9WVW9_APOLU|nr:hypothetical protein GE061_006244 [Apolygus lucorum]